MYAKNQQKYTLQFTKQIIKTITHQDLAINDGKYELLYHSQIGNL